MICVCETCIKRKLTQILFPKCPSRIIDILEIVHSDLFDPTRTESIGGAKYVMTFVDDASRWSTVKFLKSKSEALTVFKSYQSLMENQTGKKIKCLQSDNGKEYLNQAFNDHLDAYGITRRLTVAYTP